MAFRVERLSDNFGQYLLVLTCSACKHQRKTHPQALARFFGWDMTLEVIAGRLRCSKCGKRQCAVRAVPAQKPRE